MSIESMFSFGIDPGHNPMANPRIAGFIRWEQGNDSKNSRIEGIYSINGFSTKKAFGEWQREGIRYASHILFVNGVGLMGPSSGPATIARLLVGQTVDYYAESWTTEKMATFLINNGLAENQVQLNMGNVVGLVVDQTDGDHLFFRK